MVLTYVNQTSTHTKENGPVGLSWRTNNALCFPPPLTLTLTPLFFIKPAGMFESVP